MVVVKVNRRLWTYSFTVCNWNAHTLILCALFVRIYNTISILVDNSILKYIYHFKILKKNFRSLLHLEANSRTGDTSLLSSKYELILSIQIWHTKCHLSPKIWCSVVKLMQFLPYIIYFGFKKHIFVKNLF